MSEAGSGKPDYKIRTSSNNDMQSTDPLDAHQSSLRSSGSRPDRRPSAAVIPIASKPSALATVSAQSQTMSGPVTFNQTELRLIFALYGRKVAAGEWRDYALDFFRDQAIFSVYRRTSEVPLYRIEKNPRLARKQGEYAAVAASGLILKRGSDLARVLAVLDRPLKILR